MCFITFCKHSANIIILFVSQPSIRSKSFFGTRAAHDWKSRMRSFPELGLHKRRLAPICASLRHRRGRSGRSARSGRGDRCAATGSGATQGGSGASWRVSPHSRRFSHLRRVCQPSSRSSMRTWNFGPWLWTYRSGEGPPRKRPRCIQFTEERPQNDVHNRRQPHYDSLRECDRSIRS